MTRAARLARAGFVLGCLGRPGAALAQPPPGPAPGPPVAAASRQPSHECLATTNVPEASRSSPSSLEVWGALGPSVVFGDAANPDYAPSLRRVGIYGEIGVAFRSTYFIDPFLSVGYGWLASGEAHLPSGPWGAGGTLDQGLDAWIISPGLTADIWRIRLRVGLGLAVVVQRFSFRGDDHSSTQLPLAHQLGLGFNLLDVHRFRLDAEARYISAPGADVTFVTLAAVARGDLLEFGGP